MIAVVGFLHPALGELAREFEIFGSLGLVAAQLAQLRERAETANRLRAQVYVVREMASEVVRAKLVLRIESLGLEILGPLFELLPVEAGEIRVALHLRYGSQEDEQIAALFDGHLVALVALAAAIDLAVGVR